MYFGEKVGIVVTAVLLSFTFMFLIVPMGFLVRTMRRDFMGLAIDKQRATYWEQTESDGPGSRHYTPY